MKRIIILLAALVFLPCLLWYFGTYPLTIGKPTEATVQYFNTEQAQYETVVLNQEQTARLAEIMKGARPTLFIQEPVGIGNEDILITLHYNGGETKVFSLWHMRSVLYEGVAEDISMANMRGDLLHMGGSVDDALPEFLIPLCPGIATPDSLAK